jgi:flagellar hook capping protein FlgD
MKTSLQTLGRGGRVAIATCIALAALSGVVYAASGHSLGVRSLAGGSSTPPPPAGLTVSSSLNRSSIYRSHDPHCARFAYTTNHASSNHVSISRVTSWSRGVQPAGRHSFSWCGHDTSGRHVARGSYLITIRASRNGVTKSSSRSLHVRS